MRPRVVIVAALGVLLLGWRLCRNPGQVRTESPPEVGDIAVAPDAPAPRLTTITGAMSNAQLALGQRLDDPNSLTLIQPLVGIAIQRAGLAAMAAAAPDAGTAQAIQERLDGLNQQREGIKALVAGQPMETWLPNAPPEEANAYFDRMRLFGEQRALQWLATRR
jgi:hypothetical protein